MKEFHVCPKCHNASGWVGPPFEGRWAKLKAIWFHLRRGTLFSIESKDYPFVRCSSCGYVITVQEWRTTEHESLQEKLEREEFHRDYVEPHLQKPKAVRQDVSRFMKHGKLNKQYRMSIKRKVDPDEDDEDYFDEQENLAD